MPTQFTNGYALLIGVNENAVSDWALPDVAKDVEALHRVLVHPERCAYLEDHVHVILGKDATRANILAGLDWLEEKIADDGSGNVTAVVYYSGHGFRDDSVQPPGYYLIPYDVKREGLATRALPAKDFANAIRQLRPQRLLTMLDCCHAGGMAVKKIQDLVRSSVPIASFMDAGTGVGRADGAKGLAELNRGSGRAVLSSSQGEQVSYLRKDKQMSIFTYHLIEALTGHAQPGDGADEVLVSDVMSHVWRTVPQSAMAEYGATQEPDYQVSGNFPIAMLLGGKGLVKGMKPPDPIASLPPVAVSTVTNINTGGGGVIMGSVTARGVVMRDLHVHRNDAPKEKNKRGKEGS